MAGVTPRITAQYLENFQDRVVRVVGKVTQVRANQVTIESNGPVVLRFTNVRCNLDTLGPPTPRRGAFADGQQEPRLPMNHHVEVIGKILQGDLAVKVLSSTDLGANFGTRLWRRSGMRC